MCNNGNKLQGVINFEGSYLRKICKYHVRQSLAALFSVKKMSIHIHSEKKIYVFLG